MYQALSAGVSQEKVKGFLEVAQKGAIAGVTDITTAVDGLSSVVNAWGEDAISAAQASDLIFTAVKMVKRVLKKWQAVLLKYHLLPVH